MRPDALPIQATASFVELPVDDARTLFGKGYALRGTERVHVSTSGRSVSVEARPGPALRLVLDGLDRNTLGAAPFRLRGPRGTMTAPDAERIEPVLVLPAGLREAWGLTDESLTAIQLGTLVVTAVRVATGSEPAVHLDRVLILAVGDGVAAARWLSSPDGVATTASIRPRTATPPSNSIDVEGRVITENDVRRARMQRRNIHVRPGQIVTPAARSLGAELGLFVEPTPDE